MADSPGRVLLVKFRGDLRSLQGTMDDVIRAVSSMQRQLKTMQDKSHKSSEDNTAKALAGEKLKQAAAVTTAKTGEKKQTQETGLQAAIAKTVSLRKQETLELQRQLSMYKELAQAQSKASHNITTQLAQEMQGRKATQPAQGVIPVAMRTVSSAAQTAGSLAQSAEAASYQQQLMRQMRLTETAKSVAAAAPAMAAPNPLAAGLAGGLATAQVTGSEGATLEQERMRRLRVQNAIVTRQPIEVQKPTEVMKPVEALKPISVQKPIDVQKPVSVLPRVSAEDVLAQQMLAEATQRTPTREDQKQTAEQDRQRKLQQVEVARQQKKQTSDVARQQVQDATSQVQLVRETEKQKQLLTQTSASAQREVLASQLQSQKIDYDEYLAKVKATVEQERLAQLAAVDSEKRALQQLLDVKLAANKITPQTHVNETALLAKRTDTRSAQVEAASSRQVAVVTVRRPEPKVVKQPVAFEAAQEQILNAGAQVEQIRNAERQKQILVQASSATQRDTLTEQLHKEEIDYDQYLAKVKAVIEQEKVARLAAIDVEEKALQHLLEVRLAAGKISQPNYTNQVAVLSGKSEVRRTQARTSAAHQEAVIVTRQPSKPKEETLPTDRQAVLDAGTQLRMVQSAEQQKQMLMLASGEAQREEARTQLRSGELDYAAYVARIEVLIEQEKVFKLDAIAAEEKALQHLLEVELATKKISQQSYQNEAALLSQRMGARRTQVEAVGVRQKVAVSRQRPPEPREEGGEENDAGEIFRGLGMGISKGLGGGLVGSIATGLLFGGGTLMVFDQAARGIESMIEKIKELVMETGPVQQLEGQFEQLTHAAGIEGPVFMEKLQVATHGLVGNMGLLQFATSALRSNLHLTDQQTVRFATDVTELARVQGKSVPQALAVAQRGLTTGQTRGVATYLGINQRELGLNAAPRYSTIQEREQLQYRQVQGAIEGQLNKTGVAPETMTEKVEQLNVAKKNFAEDFGEGLATSSGAKAFMSLLDDMVKKFGSLQEASKAFGSAVGDGLSLAISVGRNLLGDLGGLITEYRDLDKASHIDWGGLAGGEGILFKVEDHLSQVRQWILEIYNFFLDVRGMTKVLGADLKLAWAYLNPFADIDKAEANYKRSVQSAVDEAKRDYQGLLDTLTPLGLRQADVLMQPWQKAMAAADVYYDHVDQRSGKVVGPQLPSDTVPLEGGGLANKPSKPTKTYFGLLGAIQQQLTPIWGGNDKKTPPPEDPAARQIAMQLAEAQVKLTENTEKEKLSIIQDSLDKQRDAQKQMLLGSTTDLASYLETMKGFVTQEKNAKLAQIDAVETAELGLLKTQLKEQMITPAIYKAKVDVQTQESGFQKDAVIREAHKQTTALNDQQHEDQISANKIALDEDIANKRAALDLQRSTIQHSYDEQLVDVKTYLANELDLTQKTYDLEIEAANRKFEETTDRGAAAEAQRQAEEAQALNKRAGAVQQINQKAPAETLKYNTQQAQNVQDYIDQQEQLAVAQRGGAPLPVAQQQENLQAKMNATTVEIRGQNTVLGELEASGQKYTNTWYAASTAITTATEKLVQMQQQMHLVTSTSDQILSGFGSLAVGLGSFPQGRTRALSGVGAIPGILQSFTTAQQQAAPLTLDTSGSTVGGGTESTMGALTGGAFEDTSASDAMTGGGRLLAFPVVQLKAVWVSLGFFKSLVTGSKDLPEQFKNMSSTLGPVLGALGGAAQGIASGNPVEGAAGGGALGGDIGMGIGKMFSSVANIAGPIGSIAGAAFGGILSGIIGQKQQQAADMIHTMSLKFDAVMTTFKEGVISMNEAINESEAIRNDLQAQMQSAGKKKRQQYQQALDAMNQQIIALQAEQVQMIVQMQETLPTVGATPMTDFISQLQQIVQQYAQFAGAARNASDLAQANQYLTQSLAGYAQTQMTSMTQAEQGAIQDAINLNDLYSQRQTLLQQMADQERDIMTQGVLTRQTTTAQSKMEQIAIMKQQNVLQLENLNEQISAASYRVDAEKQIFNLATTRVGLEAQLLQMQNQGTLLDMARIAALQQVVMALQSGNFQNKITGGLNINTNNPGLQAFQNLLAALGIYNNDQPIGNQPSLNLENQFLNLFNQRSAYNFGGFNIVGGGS